MPGAAEIVEGHTPLPEDDDLARGAFRDVFPRRSHLPFAQIGDRLPFHLFCRLYEHASIIVITNLALRAWPALFGNAMIPATAQRGEVLLEPVSAEDLLILRDGEPGEPEVTLSPLACHYPHRAETETVVQSNDHDAASGAPRSGSCTEAGRRHAGNQAHASS